MNFEKLENDLKEKLQKDLTHTVSVELEPQFEGENIPAIVKPRVTIFLSDADFAKTKNTAFIVQDEDVKVFLLVRARTLRGQHGVYDVVQKIAKSLVGYKPENWDKLWLNKVSFEDRKQNVWAYTVVMSGKTMIVEDADVNTGVLLKEPKADFLDNELNT